MYRVELKARFSLSKSCSSLSVPNVPCGVERSFINGKTPIFMVVPNVPCGVESLFSDNTDTI